MITVGVRRASAIRTAAVDQMPHLGRRGCLHDVGAGDVLEHREKVEFLLIVAAKRVAGLLADDRQHRLMIQQRIIEPGDEMRGAGTRGRDADAELALRIWRQAVAMNAAISSWRAWYEPDLLPSARFIAPNTPLMPSPG